MPNDKLHAYIIEELSSLNTIMKTRPELERAAIILDCALCDLKRSEDCDEFKNVEVPESVT